MFTQQPFAAGVRGLYFYRHVIDCNRTQPMSIFMNPGLPLDEMSVQDKLAVLESLWDNLCTHASDVPAPGWHGEVLASRAERVREGKSVFVPLDEMKERIRRATQ